MILPISTISVNLRTKGQQNKHVAFGNIIKGNESVIVGNNLNRVVTIAEKKQAFMEAVTLHLAEIRKTGQPASDSFVANLVDDIIKKCGGEK